AGHRRRKRFWRNADFALRPSAVTGDALWDRGQAGYDPYGTRVPEFFPVGREEGWFIVLCLDRSRGDRTSLWSPEPEEMNRLASLRSRSYSVCVRLRER